MVTLDFKNLWYIYKKPMLNIDIYRFRYKDEKKKSHSITNQTKVKAAILLSTVFVVVVQSLSCVQLIVTPWTAAHQASLSFTISWSLLKPMSIVAVMPSNHLILYHPFSSCLQSFPASGSFPMSQFFSSDGRSIGLSASASVLPMIIQD